MAKSVDMKETRLRRIGDVLIKLEIIVKSYIKELDLVTCANKKKNDPRWWPQNFECMYGLQNDLYLSTLSPPGILK
jgi:hypothetical protein